MVMECAPDPSRNCAWLMSELATQGTGSSPQSPVITGTDVSPRDNPKSKTSNWSPAWNTSTTLSVAPIDGATKVQGGASRNDVGVPELGKQKAPVGSSGAQPVAG